ncbi:hypothetical protein [Croceicoccus mobilis]|uniref:hypothetical protein n=1 Tax=Croceicoccus mobilis TaxID=1703339 RepID=UPI000B0FAC18|nr:hypothetical protein [Croceicoccus mobilis]
MTRTDTEPGSNADPTIRLRGCACVGSADSTTTAIISQRPSNCPGFAGGWQYAMYRKL